ncbi:uncharacterized protein LOC112095052, partial [Morus notabilis]|uniref:uncharacterized protein LOC112095052 n=1 Tax=Morus notabilis TaxID=981085 RepID=UPI000CED2DF9
VLLLGRCFFLGKSYSLAGMRKEAYALYTRAHSLAEDALQKFQATGTGDQAMVKELKVLCEECRSNICIEHATGIMEELKAPENLSKKISNISLTGAAKKVFFIRYCLSLLHVIVLCDQNAEFFCFVQ